MVQAFLYLTAIFIMIITNITFITFVIIIIFITNIIFIMQHRKNQYRSRLSEGVFIFLPFSLACPTFNTRGKVHLCHRQRPLVLKVMDMLPFGCEK